MRISDNKSLPKSAEWNIFKLRNFCVNLEVKYWKKIGFGTFYQYGQIHVHFKSVWFMFVIKLSKTLYRRTNVCWTNYSLDYIPKIGRFYEKHPSFFLTTTHSFSYNLAIIQQITFADGLKPSHYTSACYTACRRYSRYILMDTFWFISIIVTPTPKIVKLRRVAKIILFASKQFFVVNYSLFFRQKILLHLFWWGDIWLYLYEVMHR